MGERTASAPPLAFHPSPTLRPPYPADSSGRRRTAAGLLTVRIFGAYNAEAGSTLYVSPDPQKTYRFGADGRTLA